ncbi:superoxide dismutase (plasmid) [Sphingobium limneticum]|jgi:Fe-Mn family superoxide dismutase|uniref:superoxide dismutase n=1 Tax=Sphingomonadales TaxID=204457 RepID=UPI000B2DFA07|nr:MULTISPECIES: superoxide dismutase [unclassified Sphingomonas]TXH82449.1 MAG: superoxide dismutase [Rhizobium sp.]
MSEQPERMAPVFELPPLPYDLADLEPTLSARTLAVHHGKHHARYVDTLNRLLAEENFSAHSLEEIIAIARASETTALFNNAAQAWNHAFFWESMAKARSAPSGPLAEAIQAHFGSTAALAEAFIAAGAGHFGSGWVWLIARHGTLEVVSTHDAATPFLEEGSTPLLTCDVWEHAYYLDYQQDRPNWLKSWWEELANWSFAAQQFEASRNRSPGWHYPLPITG